MTNNIISKNISSAKAREVREWLNSMNSQWTDSPAAGWMSCYDAEANIESNASKFKRQGNNLNTFQEHILPRSWSLAVLYNVRGQSIGLCCPELEEFEEIAAWDAPMREHRDEARPADLSGENIGYWNALFEYHAHIVLAGPYNVQNIDWAKMNEGAWKHVLARVNVSLRERKAKA